MHNAVFFDKDGTLIKDIPYNVDPSKIRLDPFASQALARLQKSGFRLFIISNQPGVAKGLFSVQELERAFEKLLSLLSREGITIDDYYYCPHLKNGKMTQYAVECNCRKPMPDLILKAAKAHNIDLKRSWMVGDILNDVEAGNRAGCKTVLIDNGNETEWVEGPYRIPAVITKNLLDASSVIGKWI
ncbi:MAG: D-glycero-alpha-D-manno-heptose-1,7-bisphosphate 7-phosphatase [Ginsengibacter sp.]